MEKPAPDFGRRYTEEEYLRISAASDVKYEFRDGQLVPFGGWERDAAGRILGMAGGTAAHSDIGINVIRALGNRLAGTPCRLAGSDLRVRIPRTGRYCYPDASVTCGPRQFDPPDQQLTLTNPQVVIEVLSRSTATDDRTEKLTDYIGIPSLQEYLMVAQDRPRIDAIYRQTDGIWSIGPWAVGLEAVFTFRSLGVTVPLAEIYAGVEFATGPGGAI